MKSPVIPILWSVIFFSIGGPLIDHETSTIMNVVGWSLIAIGILSGKYSAISTLYVSSGVIYGLGISTIFLGVVLMNVFPSQQAFVINALLGGVCGAAFSLMIWRFFVSSKV